MISSGFGPVQTPSRAWSFNTANVFANNYYNSPFDFKVTAGNYVPVPIVFVNTYRGGSYTLSITDSNGNAVPNSNVVQYSSYSNFAAVSPDYRGSSSPIEAVSMGLVVAMGTDTPMAMIIDR